MNYYILEYKFHLFTIDFSEKEVQTKKEFYDKLEDCLADYRRRKESLFCGCVNYNTDFKIYKCILDEIPIDQINNLM